MANVVDGSSQSLCKHPKERASTSKVFGGKGETPMDMFKDKTGDCFQTWGSKPLFFRFNRIMALTLRFRGKHREHRNSWHIRFETLAQSLSQAWKGVKCKKTRYETTIDDHGCFTLFDLPHRCTNRKVLAIRKPVLQNASRVSLLGFRSCELLSPTPATGFYLDQPYPLYWDIAKHLRPDSILQAICQIVDISEGTLAITAHPSRQNVARLYEFRVEGLDQDLHLVLPTSCRLSYISCPEDLEDEKSSPGLSWLLAYMPTWTHATILNSDAENLIGYLLPFGIFPDTVQFLGICFWAWKCVIDELSKDHDYFRYIELCVEVLLDITTPSEGDFIANTDLTDEIKLEESKQIILALHEIISITHVHKYNEDSGEAWKVDFWLEILTIIQALRVEQSSFQQPFSMKEILEIRLLSISIRPLMVLVRASLGLPTALNILTSPRLRQVQILTQAVMYLQWDLVHENCEEEDDVLNMMELLVQRGSNKEGAVKETLAAHNDIMHSLLCLLQLELGAVNDMNMDTNAGGGDVERWKEYFEVLVSFCGEMARGLLD